VSEATGSEGSASGMRNKIAATASEHTMPTAAMYDT
jgi:hypothetical protein